jgi:prolyl-tRNA editing enzyme YbaK/EbsC (Cys-tRNA(Pro) deacylase)
MDAVSAQERVLKVLEASGRPFEVIECDPSFADTAEFCARYGYPLERSANTIVVASKRPPGRYAACVVLATTRLDVNKKVKDHLGVRKLSFAPAETTGEVTGMMIGGVTPFALPPSIPLLVDDRIMDLAWVILGGGNRSSKIKTSPQVLLELPTMEVIQDLALPIES